VKPEEIDQLRPGDIITRYQSTGELQEAVVEEVTETHVIARIGEQKAWLVKNWGLADFRRAARLGR
jgi:hypothetical protein